MLYLNEEQESRKHDLGLRQSSQLVKEEVNVNEESKEVIKHTNREKKSKIQLNTEINNIAYLFYQLRENKIIESPHLAKALSEVFLNEIGEPIQNNLFNTYFKKFAESENPSKATTIDSFVKEFKKV